MLCAEQAAKKAKVSSGKEEDWDVRIGLYKNGSKNLPDTQAERDVSD